MSGRWSWLDPLSGVPPVWHRTRDRLTAGDDVLSAHAVIPGSVQPRGGATLEDGGDAWPSRDGPRWEDGLPARSLLGVRGARLRSGQRLTKGQIAVSTFCQGTPKTEPKMSLYSHWICRRVDIFGHSHRPGVRAGGDLPPRAICRASRAGHLLPLSPWGLNGRSRSISTHPHGFQRSNRRPLRATA